MKLTPSIAERFASIALGHVTREYPHKADHVMTSDADVYVPRQVHPIFYGSFDWHSCVHGYWLLARIRRIFPQLPLSQEIDALFNEALTTTKVEMECRYLSRASASGFERPYGWAWLLMLGAELLQAKSPLASTLKPLTVAFVERFRAHLPLMTYPVQTGTHTNTAFALVLAHRYALVAQDASLQHLIAQRARAWFLEDRSVQVREPNGEDFLSPVLMEAVLMRHVLPTDEFKPWLDRFLPGLAQGEPAVLFTPPTVSDRTDGKIGHLMGLGLSRAWAFNDLAHAWTDGCFVHSRLQATASAHLLGTLDHLADDYMGEHWLATFALLALESEDWAP